MRIQARLLRRTLAGFSFLAVLMLAFGVFNPYSDVTLYVRVILLVPASVIAAGLIPGSYIHKFLDAFTNRPQLGPLAVISLFAIAGPLFLTVVSALGAYAQIYMLQLIQELDLSFIDSQEVQYIFVSFSVLGIAALVLFVWNAFDLIRARSSAQAS
ncbi:MAG: hypothetical protein IH953_02040 [Chloroflexi bacterium]|nr:hypothetical protein [Chloroflexota bacterium]